MSARVIPVPGLGVYPGDPCYDPARPSWLPYWLDDFTESDCKYQSTNILTASMTALANPDVVESNVGGVMGQAVGSGVSDIAAGVNTVASSTVGGFSNTIDFNGLLLIGGAALLLFLMVKK